MFGPDDRTRAQLLAERAALIERYPALRRRKPCRCVICTCDVLTDEESEAADHLNDIDWLLMDGREA